MWYENRSAFLLVNVKM